MINRERAEKVAKEIAEWLDNGQGFWLRERGRSVVADIIERAGEGEDRQDDSPTIAQKVCYFLNREWGAPPVTVEMENAVTKFIQGLRSSAVQGEAGKEKE